MVQAQGERVCRERQLRRGHGGGVRGQGPDQGRLAAAQMAEGVLAGARRLPHGLPARPATKGLESIVWRGCGGGGGGGGVVAVVAAVFVAHSRWNSEPALHRVRIRAARARLSPAPPLTFAPLPADTHPTNPSQQRNGSDQCNHILLKIAKFSGRGGTHF